MRRPAEELRRMLEQTLVPPPHVTELDPDTIEATTTRLADPRGNLAELYQLNSCLTEASWSRLPDAESTEVIVDYYLGTAADGYDGLLDSGSRWVLPLNDAPPWVRQLLGPLALHPVVTATLFSSDLLVGFEGSLWRLVPNRPGLQFEGTWPDSMTAELGEAVPSLHSLPFAPSGVLLLVANIVRSSYLVGDRAFRQAAISCGTLLGMLWSVLGARPPFIQFKATSQFLDHQVNSLVRCDGVERAVQLVAFVEPHHLPEEAENEHI